jgi:hypothetical protein
METTGEREESVKTLCPGEKTCLFFVQATLSVTSQRVVNKFKLSEPKEQK